MGKIGGLRAFLVGVPVLFSDSGGWRLVSNKLELAKYRNFVSSFFRTRFQLVVQSQTVVHFVFNRRLPNGFRITVIIQPSSSSKLAILGVLIRVKFP